MSESKDMTTQDQDQDQDQGQRELQSQSEREAFLRPPVDIYEEDNGITLKADLPGVSHDRLDVQVQGNNLTIEGEMKLDMPEGMEALYADVGATHFRRSFTLSNELDTEDITANISNGVLTLQLPKRAELQPRKIEIKTS